MSMYVEEAMVIGCSVFVKEKDGKKIEYKIVHAVVQGAFDTLGHGSFGDKVITLFVSDIPHNGDIIRVSQVYNKNGQRSYTQVK